MKKVARWMMMSGIVVVTSGCGVTPEFLLGAAQQSAKEAVEESIDELIKELADEILDPEQLGALLPGEENE